MTTQMIIRVEPTLKNKVINLAKSEGKSLSELVRELLENYTKERDIGAYIDNLWNSIGKKLSQENVNESDIEEAIKLARSKNA
ncbi:MAG: ribbon-helix-helix protein, CopG family [Deltaproteobacteria bacterium]|nr:ribbon-helix-helix protein, CopG family [Deltaproteobacteria bacterium]